MINSEMLMMKCCYRRHSRRNLYVLIIVLFIVTTYYVKYINRRLPREPDIAITWRYIETKLEEALKEDKGTGCEFPHMDPFSEEVMKFVKPPPSIVCPGQSWVKCFLSECRVPRPILNTFKYINCDYKDILYENDDEYTIGPPTTVKGADAYNLTKSDHVKIKCVGTLYGSILPRQWTGHATGFRQAVERIEPPSGREDSIDVLILAFDSTSKNGFIRSMPKSYSFITKELGATVLDGYNIVGDGTPAALFPILTGKTELELPDVRKSYRTAYFEDMPWIGTFQYRFKGFERQPADHYLRAFYMEEHAKGKKWWRSRSDKYCVGDTMQYKLMLNITEQFFKLDGKHFAFTFIADITHDDFNMIAIADEDTRSFLEALKTSGKLDRTFLIVMGDHGTRYSKVRSTLQGKFEERMPLMAIRLPKVLNDKRPELAAILQNNSQVLTTPHDIYATVLDAIGLQKYWNSYKIKGADLTRGLTVFEPIPQNRSCSEAGVEAHWCACVAWDQVAEADPITTKVAEAFILYINQLTQSVREFCMPRVLRSVSWVMRRRSNPRLLQFNGNIDEDGYFGKFSPEFKITKEYYQIKLEVGPGSGVYEASTTYLKDADNFVFDLRDVSRTNPYNDEPACISATHPQLNMFCYCRSVIETF